MPYSIRRHRLLSVLVAAFTSLVCLAAPAAESVTLRVSSGDHARRHTPVRVSVEIPAELAKANKLVLVDRMDNEIPAQVTAPALLSDAAAKQELNFVLPRMKAGRTKQFELRGSDDRARGFRWKNIDGKSTELRRGGRPILKYMHEAIDESSPERREQTYKVFHHVFDLAGKRTITKGPGGKYTHHRGLFFGFNRISYDDVARADIWHCTNGVHQAHDDFLAVETGPVLGRHRLALNWHGPDDEVFAKETREMTVYRAPKGHLIEFASVLRTQVGPVRLDGDPQHAGFHFRADNEVAAETNGQTYYLRPDGKGDVGETRNWPNQEDHVNLPWNCMSFVLGDTRYTAVYVDRPENPKEARFSERDYGRFGSYFEYDLTEENPLKLNYRVWIQEGEITADRATQLSADLVEPVRVEVVGG